MTGEHLLRPWHEDDVSGQGSAAGQHGLKPFSGEGDASTASGGYQCWSERLGHAGERGADASGQQHQRRELARVPLWPVAAVVGSVLRGIRIANATASACKRLGNCDSGEWWQSCQRGHLRAAGVGHAAAEVSNWASDHAPAVFRYRRGRSGGGLRAPAPASVRRWPRSSATQGPPPCNQLRPSWNFAALSEAAATARARARGSVRV